MPEPLARSSRSYVVPIRGRSFDLYVREAAGRGQLVVQPRMGFGQVAAMRDGLAAVRESGASPRIGTITVDAFTRTGEPERAAAALAAGKALNGFPITAWGPDATRAMLAEVGTDGFPVQVRHGSAFPLAIFEAAAGAGIDATEGGPVSYCLPYSRAPLRAAVAAWSEAARYWAEHAGSPAAPPHLESFGGCLFGQLCPPGLLVAISVLEGLFFVSKGIESVSLSLAQGTCADQDVGGLIALDRIRRRRLGGVSSHVVAYTFMGVFPRTGTGAERLIRESARSAVLGGAHRLIVKTAAEAHGIPSVADNIEALSWARDEADATVPEPGPDALDWADTVEREAEILIESVLRLSPDVAIALVEAFATGLLDIPFGLHPDNRGATRAAIHPETGAIVWTDTAGLSLDSPPLIGGSGLDSSAAFHAALEYNRRRYDLLAQEDEAMFAAQTPGQVLAVG